MEINPLYAIYQYDRYQLPDQLLYETGQWKTAEIVNLDSVLNQYCIYRIQNDDRIICTDAILIKDPNGIYVTTPKYPQRYGIVMAIWISIKDGFSYMFQPNVDLLAIKNEHFARWIWNIEFNVCEINKTIFFYDQLPQNSTIIYDENRQQISKWCREISSKENNPLRGSILKGVSVNDTTNYYYDLHAIEQEQSWLDDITKSKDITDLKKYIYIYVTDQFDIDQLDIIFETIINLPNNINDIDNEESLYQFVQNICKDITEKINTVLQSNSSIVIQIVRRLLVLPNVITQLENLYSVPPIDYKSVKVAQNTPLYNILSKYHQEQQVRIKKYQ